MNKKLTLSLDSTIIDFAHDYSKKSHKPISKIIEHYFEQLKEKNTPEIPKEVAELYGILEGTLVPGTLVPGGHVPDKKELRRQFHEEHLG